MEALQAVLAFVGEDPEVNAMWVVRFTSIQFVSCSLHKRTFSPFPACTHRGSHAQGQGGCRKFRRLMLRMADSMIKRSALHGAI